MIEIDGAYGEGGGQLLRLAVACSALRGVPVRVSRIRAGRPRPGLAAQHLTAVRAVASLCQAQTEGLELGSQELTFVPGPLAAARHQCQVGTAGSVTLVLQACLLPAFFCPGPVELTVGGGTDVKWSPPLDYLRYVLLPLLARLGAAATIEEHRRGYYPRGGGAVTARTTPVKGLAALRAQPSSSVQAIGGIAHVGNLPASIASRMAGAAQSVLCGRSRVEIEVRTYSGPSASGQGGAIVLWAEINGSRLGASCLAERGLPAEQVGQWAANRLLEELNAGASLDVQAADQLLPYLALANGPSQFTVRRVSQHLATLAWLLPQVLGCQIDVAPQRGLWSVHVQPAGAIVSSTAG